MKEEDVHQIIMSPSDLHMISTRSVSYACGRMTYVTDVIKDAIMMLRPILDTSSIHDIISMVQHRIDTNTAGMSYDRDMVWSSLIKSLSSKESVSTSTVSLPSDTYYSIISSAFRDMSADWPHHIDEHEIISMTNLMTAIWPYMNLRWRTVMMNDWIELNRYAHISLDQPLRMDDRTLNDDEYLTVIVSRNREC
jgi:hypothetical protein